MTQRRRLVRNLADIGGLGDGHLPGLLEGVTTGGWNLKAEHGGGRRQRYKGGPRASAGQ